MTALETAENVITQLTPGELGLFRRWFDEFDSDIWNAQIDHDATSGKLDVIAHESIAVDRVGEESVREVDLPVIRSSRPGTLDLTQFDFDDLLS